MHVGHLGRQPLPLPLPLLAAQAASSHPAAAAPPAPPARPPATGQETSAILLGWACAYLAHHPAAQEAAAAEVHALLGCGADGEGGRALQAADASRLPFIEAIVLEAMRWVAGGLRRAGGRGMPVRTWRPAVTAGAAAAAGPPPTALPMRWAPPTRAGWRRRRT